MKILFTSLLISTAHAFVVPGEMNVLVDKLVNFVPLTNDPIELATKTALLPFIIYAPFSTQTFSKKEEVQAPTEEIDFDAPLDRQIKVGHIIHRQPYTLGLGDIGTVTPPRPLQQALHLYEPENKFQLPEKDIDEQYFTLIHDECYLGKDMTAHDCVDFDPMHT